MCCCILQYTAGLLCVPTSIPHPPPPTRKQVCWHVASVESCVLARVGLKAAQVQCKLRPALSLRHGPPRGHSVWHAHARAHARTRSCSPVPCRPAAALASTHAAFPRAMAARSADSHCAHRPAAAGRPAPRGARVRADTRAQRGCIRHEHGGAVCIRPHHTPHVLLSSTISSSVHLRPAEPTRLLSCLQDTKTVPIHALHTVHSVPEANTTASGHGMGSSGSVGELAIPRNLIQWFGARTGRLVHRNCVLQTVRD